MNEENAIEREIDRERERERERDRERMVAFTNERHLVLGVALECALVAHSVICSVRFREGDEAKNNRAARLES